MGKTAADRADPLKTRRAGCDLTVRRLAACLLSGLFAVSWLVLPGFGLIDLSVTWNADWPQVLEAGWGLFATVIVAASFALVVVRPRASMPAAAQLVVATGSLVVSALAARETGLLALAALLGAQTGIVGGLLRGAWQDGSALRASFAPVSGPLLLLAGVGAVPWTAYALHMWALNREGRSDTDVTLGIDHYSVQGALALVLVVLPLVAAVRADLHPFVPVCTGVAASYLGLVSLAWPDAAGGLGRAWSIAATAWGLALIAATLAHRIRGVPLDPGRSAG